MAIVLINTQQIRGMLEEGKGNAAVHKDGPKIVRKFSDTLLAYNPNQSTHAGAGRVAAAALRDGAAA
jgi:hypothetical protein